jgi:hypothetical protein
MLLYKSTSVLPNGFFRDQRKGVNLVPATTNLFSPRKPKIKSVELAKISKIVVVGMNGNTEGAEEVEKEVLANRIANREFGSLNHVSPDILPFLRNILAKNSKADFLHSLCLHDQAHDLLDDASKLMLVIKTTLTGFYAMVAYATTSPYDHNHERTFWVDRVVPMFKYFSKITGLVEFKW